MNAEPLVPHSFAVVVAGCLGAILGSFLNVCIVRLPRDESVVRPRSRCPGCGAAIAWYDNVPVVSWLLLRARCRRCGKPISVMYPLVELATAAIWAGMVWWKGADLEAVRGAVFLTLLLGIAMTDAREYIIPHEFSIGGMLAGLGFATAGGLAPLWHALIAAAVGFGVIWAVGALGEWILKKEAMGGGDMWMMGMIGAFLGLPNVFLTIFLGALLGSVVFLPPKLLGREKLVPFGVFLAIGGAAAYLAGPVLLDWYVGFITPT